MQTQSENAPPFDQITRALGDKIGTEIDEQDLKDEFQKYLDYGVPAEQAVKTILRHHGAETGHTAPAPTSQERIPLAEVPGNAPYVNLLVRVLSHNVKTVQARGEDKQIVWGLLGDETASRPFTSWRPMDGIEKGDVLAIEGAYTKEWRNEVQIQFGDRCKIEKKEDAELPKAPETFRAVTIAELNAGDRNMEVTGRILDVQPREITVQGEAKTIFGGMLADASGKIEFTAWSDLGLEKDSVVTIQGGYVRAYRGTPQFNFDADAKVAVGAAELPSAAELDVNEPTPIWQLMEQGRNDVTVHATLLEVRDGSGLVMRCSEDGCNRVLVAGACRLHHKQPGRPDLRIKAVLDDGTGAMNVIANRELTEGLLGKDLEACQKEAQDAFRPEVIQEQLQEKLEGRAFAATGNVLVDEFGAMFIARALKPLAVDTEAGATALLAKLGGA